MTRRKARKRARVRRPSLTERYNKKRDGRTPKTKGKFVVRSPRHDGGPSEWPDATFDTQEEAQAEIFRRVLIDMARGEELLDYFGPPHQSESN